MSKPKGYRINKGEVLTGSGLIKEDGKIINNRVSHMLEHMRENSAFRKIAVSEDAKNLKLLNEISGNYLQYRENWKQQPKKCIREGLLGPDMLEKRITPLCIDIETAAVCDLACPFCFREYFATPDKLIDADFCYDLIDQAVELKVPSIKFNWRGEPLLNPKLPDFIAYAKSRGILETIINTNATMLDDNKSKELISAGLDFIIYSFDGGTKETYEKMRPGRFKKNEFDNVYKNIKRFHKIRNELKSALPYTKIQMILTEETFDEKELFFKLFADCVDDVSVSPYIERGGEISDIDDETRKLYKLALQENDLPEDTPYMKDPKGNFFISTQRKPCEQPFQRLLVTYEGRVAMCCHDWGASHPVGYVKSTAYKNDNEYDKIVNRARNGDKGFELLNNIKKSKVFNEPPEKVQTLKDIWYGREIDKVRKKHISKNVDDVDICKKCAFKDTYAWLAVNRTEESSHLTLTDALL